MSAVRRLRWQSERVSVRGHVFVPSAVLCRVDCLSLTTLRLAGGGRIAGAVATGFGQDRTVVAPIVASCPARTASGAAWCESWQGLVLSKQDGATESVEGSERSRQPEEEPINRRGTLLQRGIPAGSERR